MKQIFYVLIILLLCFNSSAQYNYPTIPSVKIDNKANIDFHAGSIYYFNDVNKTWNIDEINKKKSLLKKLVPYQKDTPNFGFAVNDIWFYIVLENSNNKDSKGFLEFSNPILDEIDLFKWDENTQKFVLEGKSGDQINFDKRPVKSRELLMPVKIKSGTTSRYLIKINNGGEQFHFDLSYKTSSEVVKDDYFHQFFYGIYFGILLFVFIFNVFMSILVKEKTSKYYVLYIFSLGILQLSLNGFSKELLWRNSDYLANHINPIFASLGVLFLLIFTYDFLKLAELMPRIARVFKFIGITVFLNVLLSSVPSPLAYQIAVLFINGMTLLLAMAIIPMAIYAVKRNFKPGRFFALAFSVLVLAVLGFVLKNFGVLPSTNLTNYGLQYGSALEVILLSIAIVDRFKDFKDTAFSRLNEINEMRLQANELLEIKVKERTLEVIQQKNQIEEQNSELEKKNVEILSSIEYAKRIQEAILPSNDLVNTLLPKNNVLYLPKDIVAGDFYWVEPFAKNDATKVFFAVGDCTGHGVPGAMVSVICHNALNLAVRELQNTQTGELLDLVDKKVTESFSLGNLQINDGMDISLACWDKTTQSLNWSGANNALWLIRNGDLIEYKANKQPIGRGYDKAKFKTHSISVEKGDKIVLFSDGYADQFGGKLKKKFKSKNLKEFLVKLHQLPVESQIKSLHQKFIDWRKDEEQIDDVCIMIVEID